jgi:hypothetical protein
MSYNYTLHTAETLIPCTSEEYDKALDLLTDKNPFSEEEQEEQYMNWEDTQERHGFSLEFDGKSLYLFAENCGISLYLPEEFLKWIGELLAKAKMPYLEIGYANTCGKLCLGSHGGGYWRIYPSGAVLEPIMVWDEASLTTEESKVAPVSVFGLP